MWLANALRILEMPSQRPGKEIQFHYLRPIHIKGKQIIKEILGRILSDAHKSGYLVNYVFCSDKYLLGLNRKHLGHDYLTDIITFDLSDTSGETRADVYISVDRVKDNARSFSRPMSEEIVRVIFHGALHLAGFGDGSIKEEKEMRVMEDKYLKLYKGKSSARNHIQVRKGS